MDRFKIIKSYITQYPNPIVLQVGDEVLLGEEEQYGKWKGWIWAEGKNNKGWVLVQVLEISEDKKTGKVLEFYTAQELDVQEGDIIEKIKSLNGWTWVKNARTNCEGWIPDEIIETSKFC